MTQSEFRQKESVFAAKAFALRSKLGGKPISIKKLNVYYEDDNNYYSDLEQLISLGFIRRQAGNMIVIDINTISRLDNIDQLRKAFQLTLNETRDMLKELDNIKTLIAQNSMHHKETGN